MLSPENIFPNILPRPPPEVSISMFGDIQLIEPASQQSDSPLSSEQITTPIGSPLISYRMLCLLSKRMVFFTIAQGVFVFLYRMSELCQNIYEAEIVLW